MEVLRFPHPALKAVCSAPEEDVGPLVEGLLDLMESFPRCVGIAAPQVGSLVRVCVVDCSLNPKISDHHGRLVLVEPVITEFSETTEIGREGCLSIPDLTANVRRAVQITVRARDLEPVECVGFEARVVQHELDHLDGLLFLDRVVSLKDDVFRRKRYA